MSTYPLTWTPEEIEGHKRSVTIAKRNAAVSPSSDPVNDWSLLATWSPDDITPGLVAELLLAHDWTRAPAALRLKQRGAQTLADEVNDGDYNFRGCGLDKLTTTATALLKAAQRRGLPVKDKPLVIQFKGFSVEL